MRWCAAVAMAVAMTLGGCGSSSQLACHPSPPPPGPQVEAGPLTVQADRGVVPVGGTITITVEVSGPLTYHANCEGPVLLIVSDSSDLHVHSGTSAADPPGGCGEVDLGEGQRRVYDLSWRPDPTLPPGAYTATLILDDRAPVNLSIRVGPAQTTRPC